MFPGLTTILLAYHYTIYVLAAPYVPQPLERRNSSSSPPTITTRVLAANGTDVTSSFHTLVYFQSSTSHPTSNLTGRQNSMIRLINFCRSPAGEFLGSTCTHTRKTGFSLLNYTVRCKEESLPRRYNLDTIEDIYAGMPRPEPRYYREEGSCLANEICVDSMPNGSQELPIATCVDTMVFLGDPEESRAIHAHAEAEGTSVQHYIWDSLRDVGSKKTGVSVSGQQGAKPVGLQRLEVDIGAESGGSKVLKQTCKDCFGLRTQPAAPDADFISIQATLLATAATTGLIWVTVFAG